MMNNFKQDKEHKRKLEEMSTGQFIYDIARTDENQVINVISLIGPLGYFDNTWIGELYILIALGDLIKFHKRLQCFIDDISKTKSAISKLRLVLLGTETTELEYKTAKLWLGIYNEQLHKILK